MDEDESFSPSVEQSDINNPMMVAAKAFDASKKRKLLAEESDLLPQSKHFCLEQQASLPDSSCLTSNTNTNTCSEASTSASFTSPSLYMLKDSFCLTGSSNSDYATSSVDQYCSKINHETQEDVEDFTHMEFIFPESEFAVKDHTEVLNPIESYILSSARWSVSNQLDSEEATTKQTTIDQEFEKYFSTLMM